MSKAVRRLPPPTHWPEAVERESDKRQEGGLGDGACWRFVAKVKWRPAANLHFMCQFLHFLSSYQRQQREQNCCNVERGERKGESVRHAGSKWVRVLRIQAASQSLSLTRRPFAQRIMNMMGSLGISVGQWGAILATKI